MKELPWVVFSDLDESLLDRATYSFAPAGPAIEELRRRRIPMILCTSKTAAETLYFQGLLGINEPFIVEGGGGVYVPKGYFEQLPRPQVDRGPRILLPLSVGHEEVLRGLGHLKEYSANSIRAFDDMSPEEISDDTGLPLGLARLAKEREFDEPFRFVRREAEFEAHLGRIAGERMLRVTKGGRYYHLHGDTDKGRGVTLLLKLFQLKLGAVRSIGIGDSQMDFPMLTSVDVPIAVRRHDDTYDTVLKTGVKGLRCVDGKGPVGWNTAILEVLGVKRDP